MPIRTLKKYVEFVKYTYLHAICIVQRGQPQQMYKELSVVRTVSVQCSLSPMHNLLVLGRQRELRLYLNLVAVFGLSFLSNELTASSRLRPFKPLQFWCQVLEKLQLSAEAQILPMRQ